MFDKFAFHPCAGVMLIFSVSFQFWNMCSQSKHLLGLFKRHTRFPSDFPGCGLHPSSCLSLMFFLPPMGWLPSPVSNNVLLILQDQVQMVSLPGSCSWLLFILSLLWISVTPPPLTHIILCLVLFVYLLLLLLSRFSRVRLCATP